MSTSRRTRLSAMMFLYFFSVGSWVVTLPTFLISAPHKGGLYLTATEVGWISSANAISAMLAQPIVGLLADRFFRAERVLAVACMGCGLMLVTAGWWCEHHFPRLESTFRELAQSEVVQGRPVYEHLADATNSSISPVSEQLRDSLERIRDNPTLRQVASEAFAPLFILMLLQCFGAQIGLTLTTVIALRNLADPATQFARVRLWGTIGWIVAGNVVGVFLFAVSAEPLYLAGGAAMLTGVYAFTLPATPPLGRGKSLSEAFGWPALRLLRDRAFVVFLFVAFGSAVFNQFYVVFGHSYMSDLGIDHAEQVMTLAQVVEVGCMFAVPLFHPRQHLKALLAIGLAGWAIRALSMASLSPDSRRNLGDSDAWRQLYFFSVVAAIFVDREAPMELRASAQAIVAFVAAGVGPWTGNLLAAACVESQRFGSVVQWQAVWLIPTLGSTLLLGVFVAFFHLKTSQSK